MPQRRSWTDEQLQEAVRTAKSYRQVIFKLGLVPAGGNYTHVKRRIKEMGLETEHFLGRGWNIDLLFKPNPAVPIKELLVRQGTAQSYVLKKRLFAAGMKTPACELCGWNKKSKDGRIPVELDHINGDRYDNRIENLRILCPNCHSLQATHRGLNRGKNR